MVEILHSSEIGDPCGCVGARVPHSSQGQREVSVGKKNGDERPFVQQQNETPAAHIGHDRNEEREEVPSSSGV